MQQKYCCHVSYLYEEIMVELNTNATSVTFIVVNNRQNNENSAFLSHLQLDVYVPTVYILNLSQCMGLFVLNANA